jgi:ribosomal protein S18 acetylase RimI-like enzyme
MKLDRYQELIDFWKNTGGLWISDDDSCENLDIYLKRNPKLSFIALSKNSIIGTIKCGYDGRRGYLHHLAVKKEFRKEGIAKALIKKCLENLQKNGIPRDKVRVFVLDTNKAALEFWKHNGFEEQVYDYRTLRMNNTTTTANPSKKDVAVSR